MALVTASRGLGNTITDELAKDKITYIDLLELHFDSSDGGTQFFTNGQFSPQVSTTTSGGSQTFNATGQFLSYEMVKETEAAKVNEINIVMSGIYASGSNTVVSILLNKNYVERRVVIHRQFLNTNGTLLGSPVMIFDGELKNFTIQETEQDSTITMKSASVFFNFEDSNGRRTTETNQLRYFPSDRGMEFASVTTKDIRWGRPDAN